jgi:multiple sugar transport system ATP-binding protein
VRLGVRAESIGLADPHAAGAVPATVQVFEPLGSATLLTVDLAGQQVKVQASASYRADPGDNVWLSLKEEHQRWFDAETSLALDVGAAPVAAAT